MLDVHSISSRNFSLTGFAFKLFFFPRQVKEEKNRGEIRKHKSVAIKNGKGKSRRRELKKKSALVFQNVRRILLFRTFISPRCCRSRGRKEGKFPHFSGFRFFRTCVVTRQKFPRCLFH